MKTTRKQAIKLINRYRKMHTIDWSVNRDFYEFESFLMSLFDIKESELKYGAVRIRTSTQVGHG